MSAAYRPPTLDKDQRRVLNALLAMQRQSWEQGVASHALLDLEQHTLVEVMARDSVTRQTSDGRLADLSNSGDRQLRVRGRGGAMGCAAHQGAPSARRLRPAAGMVPPWPPLAGRLPTYHLHAAQASKTQARVFESCGDPAMILLPWSSTSLVT